MVCYTSIAIACICAILVIYPYVLYPLILRMAPTRPVKAADVDAKPCVTLLFSAYNEAASIETKIENIRELKASYPRLECFAYNDCSTDATGAILERNADILEVVTSERRTGKAHGMKVLVERARGEILVFTDANVTLHGDAIERLISRFADPDVGGVCGTLEYLGADDSVTAQVGSAYWRLEEFLKAEESRTGNVIGADGSIFAIRRELYPTFPDSVLDDLTVSMAAVFAGKRLIRAADVIAYERLVANRHDEFSRKVRIASRAFHTHRFLAPQLRKMAPFDKFKYMSRKFIRWFGALFLVIGFIAACTALWTMSPWLVASAVLAVAAVGAMGVIKPHGPASTIVEIVLALFATLFGIIRAMSGHTVVIWSPAKSR
jgi:cellulose synthase/poly-beta-1,6-N-acetylglucosamine synthase-like glycosyltransferase